MKTFTLNPTPQTQAFLAEKRKDSVTGETFKEGDEIVFCASCKSAFLKGSWEYMGGQHCGQSDTLEVFTEIVKLSESIKIKKTLGKMLYRFHVTRKQSLALVIVRAVLALAFIVILKNNNYTGLLAFLMCSPFILMLANNVFLSRSHLSIFERGISLSRKELLSYREIDRIEIKAKNVRLRKTRHKIMINVYLREGFRKSVTLTIEGDSQGFKKTLSYFLDMSKNVKLVFDTNSIDTGSLIFLKRLCENNESQYTFNSDAL